MGKKRKHNYSEEEIRRKIKKLTDKLPKPANIIEDEIIFSADEQSLNNFLLESPYGQSFYNESPLLDTVLCEPGLSPALPQQTAPQVDQPLQLASPLPPAPSSPLPLPPPSPKPGPSVDKEQPCTEELELGEDILQLLGDASKEETLLGPSIHKDVARRWQDLLAKGLSKDVKEALLKDYLVPNNCDLLVAPALNSEVKAALPEALVKRDSSLAYKQKHLGTALSALATVTQMIISNETSKQKLLKPLSDACRILCDSHHAETKVRRGFVISSINAKMKDALAESSRGKLLFGENISEKLKAVKVIQQSGNALKNIPNLRLQRPNVPPASTSKGRLNYMPQHRKMDNKLNGDRRRAPIPGQRLPQSSSVRRPTDRPLPAKPQAANRR